MTTTDRPSNVDPGSGDGSVHDDVFVSYSRVDGDFVRRVQDGLGTRGLTSWVDWQDISPSAEWMQEILGAIESTDTFVFLMSPDSIRSEVCARELEHAVGASKRIVPVVHRDVTGSDVPEALAKLNWLFLRDDDDFETGIDALVATIRTDLDRVKLHTRLLVRGREWERAGRDRGKLLRGNDLTEAERFLGSSGGGVHPVESQVLYVSASRRSAGRRQRSLIAGVSIALVVALVLASLALVQRGEARAQRDEARARALAASSIAQLDLDPELSLLLATQASRISDAPEVASALRQALSAAHEVRVLAIPKIGLDMLDVDVSPDGRFAAAGDALGRLHLWDLDRGTEVSGAQTKALSDAESRLGFGPDGHELFVAGNGLGIVPVDERGGTGPTRTLIRRNVADATLLHGSRIAVAGNGIAIRDTRDGGLVATIDRHAGWTCIAASPDGRRIVTGNTDGTAAVWDLGSGRIVQRLVGHEGAITAVDFSPDGRTLATASADRSARIWDARTGAQVAVLPHTAPVTAVAFGDSPEVVGTGDENGIGRIWDLATSEPVATLIGHRDRITAMAFRPGTDQVLTSADDGTVRVWRIGAGVPDAEFAQGDPQAATPMPDGTLAVLSKDASVSLLDPATGAITHTFTPPEPFRMPNPAVATDPHGHWLATSGPKGMIDLWDTASGKLRTLGPIDSDAPAAEGFGLFPDGSKLAMMVVPSFSFSNSAYAGTWNVETGVPLTASDLPPVNSGPYAAMDVSSNGRLVAVSIASPPGGQDMAVVLDAATGQEIQRFVGHDDYVVDASFSPGGRRLVTASWDGTAAIWDVSTGARIATLAGSRGPVVSADYSPDGSFVVTASDDGTVRVWSADGDQIEVLRTAVHPSDARFTADGRSLVAVGDGRVRVYRCEVCSGIDQLVALAQGRVTRELTADERAKYLPG